MPQVQDVHAHAHPHPQPQSAPHSTLQEDGISMVIEPQPNITTIQV